MQVEGAGAPPEEDRPVRLAYLDGIRGLAALYVVVVHVWSTTWPDGPGNGAPWWLGWLTHAYGHFVVAVFIVVSGFSLALVPVRNGRRLAGGTRLFLRRRTWRIVPPYWAALVLSSVVIAITGPFQSQALTLDLHSTTAFLLVTAFGVPLILVISWAFSQVFEQPFLHRRSLRSFSLAPHRPLGARTVDH